ncbi:MULTISPECIES: nuclear transport factor 2 family protein [unclassified Endozoicomonas]|uniref:nuclear transport factor 2 family protein n=2 Tax=Endozoicomonas TaxID=305899 RepID=UPI0021486131|nr:MULTISPECIES: nuclear transport factor 2 family protein [unclassified Endozoicomonas]
MSVKLSGESLTPFLHIVKQYDHYIQSKDIRGIMSLFVTDDEPHSFGLHVNLNERKTLEQRFTDYFNAGESCTAAFEAGKSEPIVYHFGEAACLCMMLPVKGFEDTRIRVTIFLENHCGQWLIRHQHISPSPD